MKKKTCKICGKQLFLIQFYKAASTKDGRNSLCKLCYNLKVSKSSKIKYKQHKLKGLCVRCDLPALVDRVYCEKHTLIDISLHRLGTKKRWKDINELLERQNNICYYSGKPLKLGDNASLDHIVPISKGGSNDIGNLCWADINVNKMKRDLPLDEFLTLISDIYHNSVLICSSLLLSYSRN